MPGKKSLSKMEKQQVVKEKPKEKESKVEKNIGRLDMPDVDSKELMDHLIKMKAITPTQLSTQMNVRVSVAKRILNELRLRNIVSLAASSQNVKVYSLNQAEKA